jgi:hypothetical protein
MTVSLSTQQAHAFALAVYGDIKAYCEAHKDEFEQFLREEQASGEERGGDEGG